MQIMSSKVLLSVLMHVASLFLEFIASKIGCMCVFVQ